MYSRPHGAVLECTTLSHTGTIFSCSMRWSIQIGAIVKGEPGGLPTLGDGPGARSRTGENLPHIKKGIA